MAVLTSVSQKNAFSPTIPQAGQSEAEVLHQRATAWQNRPLLRDVYTRYFTLMCAQLAAQDKDSGAAKILELGGGSGNFKEYFATRTDLNAQLLATDIIPTPHVDLAVDAMQLPFEPATIDDIIMQDVLHHLPYPLAFFREAARVLRPGGRIIMTEPYISAASRIGFKLVHPEPVDMGAKLFPETVGEHDPVAFTGTGAFASNQGIPTLLFERDLKLFQQRFPQFQITRLTRMSCLVYPLSGGFSGPCLIPHLLQPLAWGMEKLLTPLSRLLGFRMLVVIEKVDHQV